ncbi:hypothetical protein Dsin_013966 [Dipteronia sinensis]|uniref:BED-type domain-containing protein n=1 Tax=Dipteronia sinensis TaxID=43782 RepID=A0AAE0E9H4_9ROSI|nr:hypothetical protein Dsin_013966 [Dipteronia sinensis]
MSTSKSITQDQDQRTPIPTHSSHNEVTNIDAESGDIEIDSCVNEDGKRKLTSKVWDSFNREKINGVWTAICKGCNKKLSGKGTSGTSHLKKHRDNCPRLQFRDVGQMLKATKTKERDVEIKTFKFDQDTTRKELANMVILHEYPLSMVEHSWFHRFMRTAQPLFKIPSRNTLKSDILQIYDYERAKLKGLLEKIRVGLHLLQTCGHLIIKGKGSWQSRHILLITLGLYKVES